MYIVFETDNNIDSLRVKYLLLELDTLQITEAETVKTYCVIDKEHVNLQEMPKLDSILSLHEGLIKNYKLQNWDYCNEAIQHLTGSFKGEVDSYYGILATRISKLKTQDLPANWDGSILPDWSTGVNA